jgi:hypothetical protein
LAGTGLSFIFALGVKGLGGVFSIRRRTSSRMRSLDTDDFPQQVLLDLYAVTGELVIQWGMFEGALNAMIALIYHDFDGKKYQATIPQPFEQRLKLHAACFNKVPVLAPYALEARAIRSLARETSVVRDFIAHGFLSFYNTETGAYNFVRLDRDGAKTMHKEIPFKATAAELMAKTEDIERLIDLSHTLINKLFAITPRLNQANKATGNVRIKVTIRDRLVQCLCNLHEQAGGWLDRLGR